MSFPLQVVLFAAMVLAISALILGAQLAVHRGLGRRGRRAPETQQHQQTSRVQGLTH